MFRSLPLIVLLLMLLATVGCQGSRWAKRDADYHEKYDHHTGNLAKMTKQSVDARHVRNKGGVYIAASGRGTPFAAGAELGVFGYSEPWLEARGGLAGLVHDGDELKLSGGLSGSMRVQTPTRLAPFAGLGVYGGWAGLKSAEDDGIDNDDNGWIDERGETANAFTVAVFPEVGLHYWLNHRTRLTTSVSYYLTDQGRNDDFLFYSIALSFFPSSYEKHSSGPSGNINVSDHWDFIPPDPSEALPPLTGSPYADLTIEQSAPEPLPAGLPTAEAPTFP